MTDKDIIKAFEYCKEDYHNCKDCVAYFACMQNTFIGQALDLINRQKAEVEKLKKIAAYTAQRYLDKHAQYIDALSERDEIRTEAIKEFAEKLKKELSFGKYIQPDQIDNLIEEMTGERDEKST